MKRLHVRERVMMSLDACTSGTTRLLTIASLQRLKTEVRIPAPVDCEMRSVIKFLNARSIAPIEIHRQLCHKSFPLVAQNCHGAPVQIIVRQVSAKAADTRTQRKVHGVCIDISTAVLW